MFLDSRIFCGHLGLKLVLCPRLAGSHGHDVVVHQAITFNAAKSAKQDSSG